MNLLILNIDECATARIDSCLHKVLPSVQLHKYATTSDALSVMDQSPIDLFLIDLDTDSSLELIAAMRRQERHAMTWLIVTASDESMMTQCFQKFHCFSYIVKPIDYAYLAASVKQLSQYTIVDAGGEYLTVNNKGTDHRIAVDSIKYIEVNLKQLRIITDQMSYELSRYPLAKVKRQLPWGSFIQCHRSYIVNKSCVNAFHYAVNNPYLMVGEDSIPIGNTYMSSIRALFEFPQQK